MAAFTFADSKLPRDTEGPGGSSVIERAFGHLEAAALSEGKRAADTPNYQAALLLAQEGRAEPAAIAVALAQDILFSALLRADAQDEDMPGAASPVGATALMEEIFSPRVAEVAQRAFELEKLGSQAGAAAIAACPDEAVRSWAAARATANLRTVLMKYGSLPPGSLVLWMDPEAQQAGFAAYKNVSLRYALENTRDLMNAHMLPVAETVPALLPAFTAVIGDIQKRIDLEPPPAPKETARNLPRTAPGRGNN
jgi:hypothetical protein